MNEYTIEQPQKPTTPAFTLVRGGLLQRKCACGQHTLAGGECAECRRKRLGLPSRTSHQADTTKILSGHSDVSPSVGYSIVNTVGASGNSPFEKDFSHVPTHNASPTIVQPKLKINQPGDKYEREADHVAEMVMRMPDKKASDPALGSQTPPGKCPNNPKKMNIDCKIASEGGIVREDCQRIEQIVKGIKTAEQLARRAANALISGEDKYQLLLEKHFGRNIGAKRDDIIDRFLKIAQSLSSKKYICAACETEKDTSEPHICAQAPCSKGGNLKEIILCPPFGQAGCPPGPVILHEAAHNEGACGDVKMGGRSAYPPPQPAEAVDNAYSYENFAVETMQPAADQSRKKGKGKEKV